MRIRGAAEYESNDYAAAIADESAALLIEPKSAFAYRIRAAARYFTKGPGGRLDNAGTIADDTAAIGLDPTDASAFERRGAAYFRSGDYRAALADEKAAIVLDPKSSFAYRYRGLAYLELHEYALAASDEKQSIVLDPNNAIAYEAMGDSLAAAGSPSEARQAYERALQLEPGNAGARRKLGALRAASYEPGSAVVFASFAAGGAAGPLELADASGSDDYIFDQDKPEAKHVKNTSAAQGPAQHAQAGNAKGLVLAQHGAPIAPSPGRANPPHRSPVRVNIRPS
jgi:tetratricopeptide (TPR) repeat protein